MAHSLQPGAQGAQEPFDFNQIFIGREQQMAEFCRLLREWKYMLAQEEADAPGTPEFPSPRNKLPGLVVLLYGRGGFGKSTLLNRYYGIAAQANEQGLGGRLTLCSPVDWEFAVEGRRTIYNPSQPSQGQALDPLAYYKDLCVQLASRLDRQPGDFRAYQQAVGEVEKVRHESGKILEEVRREQDDLGSALRGATIDIVASALSTYVPGSKGIVQNEKVKKGADTLLQLTGEQISYLYQRFQRRLGERLEEYLDPARRLGFALGRDLAHCAANYPLLIFFDTYEEVDEGDQLLRLVMAAAGPRVGWIIAGRDNLWSGVGQRERSTTPEYGYKDLVPFERGLSINFNSEDVGAFTPDNIREYFELLCQHFPCEPPLPMLAQDEITRVWDVTKGIPLTVNIAATLYSETVDINKVTEEVEGRKEIIDKMVYRYLQHTRIDESERGKLYALALLRRTDESVILARALGLTPEEAKTRYKETLSHLHRRYSFIFTEKGEPSLHQEVRHFLRLFLLERRKEPEIQAINSSLKESIETALQELEQRRAYSTLKERLLDEDWTALYLDLCEQLYWLDLTEGLRYLLPFMIVATIYNRRINREARQIGAFFANSLPMREKSRWNWATNGLIYFYSRKSSSEALALEELHRHYSQSPGRLPALLNYPQELEAALYWRLGDANRWQNEAKAVEWYEKAFEQLPQEEELKEALAEAYYDLGYKLHGEKRYNESIHFLNQAIELEPKHIHAFIVQGITYAGLQQFDKAINNFNTAIRLNPSYAIAYLGRGYLYLHVKDIEKAQQDFAIATDKGPEYVMTKWMHTFASLTNTRPGLDLAERLEQIAAINP
ncbi:hypothetical protein KSD_62290 [Ktedonobacter sp. SOSP1-85]|uniref:tetratricopeptide repeat protein n=1 Tax=Ktedonobacter sp. SOSP1-85 TaxID=2778367 RepID=UPI0019151E2E|nr:tetratricopeptide repeat protein [Ktedonobacter sp. SOSP1-85]GHO78458.1 hypothetical protein KSD_62290 [Ktedonobacter sp. SOSP1-85]